jgi:hypothetical protein
MSPVAQVFGRRDHGTLHTTRWPASEKRQGTKSRVGDGSGAAGAMGISPEAQTWMWRTESAALCILPRRCQVG